MTPEPLPRFRHRWGDHVGELELRLEADDEPGVFAAALGAMEELLGDDGAPDAQEWFELAAEGADRAGLLAAWLEEVVVLAEQEGIVPTAVTDLVLERAAVSARVGGYRGNPPHLVKAVTYHRLAFERTETGWAANVVLDV